MYDRQLTAANIFAIQTEIATAIADALRATLSPDEERRLATVPTDNLGAYEAYLLGKQHLRNRNSGAYSTAVEYFQKAIELDRDFSLAYVGLAETYILQVFYTGVPREETLEKGRDAAERAIALNGQLGEAYNALAAIKQDTYDYEGAERDYKRALELNPNYAQTYHWYGWMLTYELGRPEDALEIHKQAVELDPLSGPLLSNIATDLFALGRFDEAAQWIDLSFERAPSYVENDEGIGQIDWLIKGRLDEAIVSYRKVAALDPGNVVHASSLGLVYLDLGDLTEAERWIRRSIELGPDAFFSNGAMCMLQQRLGNEVEAFDHASRANAIFPYAAPSIRPLEFLRDRDLRAGRALEARALYERHYPELASRDDPRVGRRNFEAAIGLALVALRVEEPDYANLLLERSLEVLREVPRLGPFGHGIADAKVYALRGESEKALSTLRRAIDEGWRFYWWHHLERDLSLELLRGEPEFQAMVEELEAEMSTQLERVREMERSGELATIPEISTG
jgi:tetratricopeptide (TPR) repeat protein